MEQLRIQVDNGGHFSCNNCDGSLGIGQLRYRWYVGCKKCGAKAFFFKGWKYIVWAQLTVAGKKGNGEQK